MPNNEFSTRHYPNGDMTESQVAENRSQNQYNIKLGFDWYLSNNQTLTLFGLYDYEWHTDTTRVWYFKNREHNSPIRKYGFNESKGTGFTNVRITLKANQNNKISLFYNRRIDRPGEDILRIFPKYDDPELLKIGNPKLRPQFTDALELASRFT